jgi:tetratricopeptide (TPR) repeat protein
MIRSTVRAMKLVLVAAALASVVSLGACDTSVNESKTELALGNKALGSKGFDEAITHCEKAKTIWRDNHSAFWCLGIAYTKKGDWAKAADAFNETVTLAPDQPMYQMWLGIALYEKAVDTAKHDQATKEGKKLEEVEVDLGSINFQNASQHIQEAVKLNDNLWRAHYYLGKIYRTSDKPKEAAQEFTKAIQADAHQQAPYVALEELYRGWDYTDAAIKVAQAGTVNVVGQQELSEIYYDLGMGYDDKRQNKEAVDAFTKAIESYKDNHKAKFQRGQAYFRDKDYLNAKRDLEEFSKNGGASMAFEKGQASKMLMDIAVANAPKDAPPPDKKLSPDELVKQQNKKKK